MGFDIFVGYLGDRAGRRGDAAVADKAARPIVRRAGEKPAVAWASPYCEGATAFPWFNVGPVFNCSSSIRSQRW